MRKNIFCNKLIRMTKSFWAAIVLLLCTTVLCSCAGIANQGGTAKETEEPSEQEEYIVLGKYKGLNLGEDTGIGGDIDEAAALELIWDKIAETTRVIKYPDGEIEAYMSDRDDFYRTYAQYYELEFEKFIEQYMHFNIDEYDNAGRKEAENEIRKVLMYKAIAKAEKIAVTESEYAEAVASYWEHDPECASSEEFVEQYGEEYIKEHLLWEKVCSFLLTENGF